MAPNLASLQWSQCFCQGTLEAKILNDATLPNCQRRNLGKILISWWIDSFQLLRTLCQQATSCVLLDKPKGPVTMVFAPPCPQIALERRSFIPGSGNGLQTRHPLSIHCGTFLSKGNSWPRRNIYMLFVRMKTFVFKSENWNESAIVEIYNSKIWIENSTVKFSIQISELKIPLLKFQFRYLNWKLHCWNFNSDIWIENFTVEISIQKFELKFPQLEFQFRYLNGHWPLTFELFL